VIVARFTCGRAELHHATIKSRQLHTFQKLTLETELHAFSLRIPPLLSR
jgi:hypothetical protein